MRVCLLFFLFLGERGFRFRMPGSLFLIPVIAMEPCTE